MSTTLTSAGYLVTLAGETYRSHAFRASTVHDTIIWQRSLRALLWRRLGIDRIAARGRCDLMPRCEGIEQLADHTRELWRIQTEPGFFLPFYVLRPLATAGEPVNRPVVITPHGHGKAGKRTYVGIADTPQEEEQIVVGERDVALQAVREGYVALAPDVRAFGEMRLPEDLAKDATCSCRQMQMRAFLLGRTLIGERVWDMMRLIDFAASQPGMDASRVVITGNSGGGTVTLFAAAMDERFRAAIPGSYFCTFAASIGSMSHCECNYVPGILEIAEMYDVAGLIAPRPFMAVNGREDRIFPIHATQEAFARLQEVYRVFGAEDQCRLFIGNGGHRYYKQDVWPFVKQVFSRA